MVLSSAIKSLSHPPVEGDGSFEIVLAGVDFLEDSVDVGAIPNNASISASELLAKIEVILVY